MSRATVSRLALNFLLWFVPDESKLVEIIWQYSLSVQTPGIIAVQDNNDH